LLRAGDVGVLGTELLLLMASALVERLGFRIAVLSPIERKLVSWEEAKGYATWLKRMTGRDC
jgi:hypothetical protein